MIAGLYHWTLSLAGARHAVWLLALVSFAESSVFPIPPDVLLIPMILARPERAFLLAGVCTLASVAGGAAGYAIGALLHDGLGQRVAALYGMEAQFAAFQTRYNELGPWAVLVAGVTPFPYKVITIVSGVTGLNLGVFMVSSLIARALRFFVIAGLLWKFGAPIKIFIERRLNLLFWLFVALLVGGFAVMRYL